MNSQWLFTMAIVSALAVPVARLPAAEPTRTASSDLAQRKTKPSDSDASPLRDLPPFVDVAEHGSIPRQAFPVSGAIPLPKGVLREDQLDTLRLRDAAGNDVLVQLAVNGRWPDGSTKWLSLDFPTRQPSGVTARYRLSRDATATQHADLARRSDTGIVVNTGPLRVTFNHAAMNISRKLDGPRWASVSEAGFISRIGVRRRDQAEPTHYFLDTRSAQLETNGPQRAVVRVTAWHQSDDGDRFSPSVIRLTFYRDQPIVRVHHTFVLSKNPDTHLITDISLRLPLKSAMQQATFAHGKASTTLDIGRRRVAVFQENLHQPSYPGFYFDREFRGRYRVLHGSDRVATGRRYCGGLTLRNESLGIGVYLTDAWQLSPKALTYDPETKMLQIGLYPGQFAGELDLARTEVQNPRHYRRYREQEKDQWGKYTPTYVPHDLVHSAMGMSRTHEMVFWFGDKRTAPGPKTMARLFEDPLVPFVSGRWNVKTGVMGRHAAPDEYDGPLQDVTSRMVDQLHHVVRSSGWYGLLTYGNFRYGWDKTNNRWMKYHPKYAWYHAGHLMEGGTLTQVLWNQYLRFGDSRDYRLARARSRQVLDLSVVHYHDQSEYIGAMLRHGGPDPWIGHRKLHGAHCPIAGLPRYFYVTGDPRAADVLRQLARKHYQYRDLNHSREMDTDLANMVLFYELFGDQKYLDRAAEYVNYYYQTRKEAADELTYINYRTTALRWFYRVCEDARLREQVKAVFLDSFLSHFQQRGHPGNPEMAAFAYELRRDATAARWLDESLQRFVRQGSGQMGWYDNMLLVSPNEAGLLSAAAYARYWQKEVHAEQVAAVRFSPDGGTFDTATRVILSCDTPGATIRYTVDGTQPGPDSPVYNDGVLVERTTRLSARGFQGGLKPSVIAFADFAIQSIPFDTTDLQAWFRNDRGLETVGARAVRWADQSGHGRHAVAGRNWTRPNRSRSLPDTQESAPEILASALGRFPVLCGDWGHYLELERFVALDGDATLVLVCFAPRGDTGPLIGDGDDGHVAISDVPPGRLSVRWNVGVDTAGGEFKEAVSPGHFVVCTVIRKGHNVRLFCNGAQLSDQRLKRVTPMNLRVLLAMRPWQAFSRSCIAELLVFRRAVDHRQRLRIEEYLDRKHGPFPARSALSDQLARRGMARDAERSEAEPGESLERAEAETPSAGGENTDGEFPWRVGILKNVTLPRPGNRGSVTLKTIDSDTPMEAGKEQSFALSASVDVQAGQRDIRLGDLRIGRRVMVTLTRDRKLVTHIAAVDRADDEG